MQVHISVLTMCWIAVKINRQVTFCSWDGLERPLKIGRKRSREKWNLGSKRSKSVRIGSFSTPKIVLVSVDEKKYLNPQNVKKGVKTAAHPYHHPYGKTPYPEPKISSIWHGFYFCWVEHGGGHCQLFLITFPWKFLYTPVYIVMVITHNHIWEKLSFGWDYFLNDWCFTRTTQFVAGRDVTPVC